MKLLDTKGAHVTNRVRKYAKKFMHTPSHRDKIRLAAIFELADKQFLALSTSASGTMGGVLKKRKKRTNVPKIKKKHKVLRHGDKRINIGGNALIAENWYVQQRSCVFA